jgi:hypothetical protein
LAKLPQICEPDNEPDNETSEEIVDNPNLSESVSSNNLNKVNSLLDFKIPNVRGFKMAFLNIASLPKHIDEFRIYMSVQTFDLIAFNETRLNTSIKDGEVNICDFDIIRKDRSRNGGGVCIYLGNTITYYNRSDIVPVNLEAVCLEIIKPCSLPFLVCSVYRPPNSSADFFMSFESLIRAIDNENKEFYILGDLNGDMLKSSLDQPTKTLISLYELYQLSQLIVEPTRVTCSSSSLIDHLVTTSPEKIVSSGVIHLGISDHSLIYGIRKLNSVEKNQEKLIEFRNMKHFDEKLFKVSC